MKTKDTTATGSQGPVGPQGIQGPKGDSGTSSASTLIDIGDLDGTIYKNCFVDGVNDNIIVDTTTDTDNKVTVFVVKPYNMVVNNTYTITNTTSRIIHFYTESPVSLQLDAYVNQGAGAIKPDISGISNNFPGIDREGDLIAKPIKFFMLSAFSSTRMVYTRNDEGDILFTAN
jgi:hypothetical protein